MDSKNNRIEIKPINSSQFQEVKRMIVESAIEVWQYNTTVEEFLEKLEAMNEFYDIDTVQTTYFDNNGIFLVLLDNGKIVGAGAIKQINKDICELKRMWFLKEYRNKGLGSKMATQLIAFAREHGYKKIRLDVYQPELQKAAVIFYKKLGFYEIPPYNHSDAKLFMEKQI